MNLDTYQVHCKSLGDELYIARCQMLYQSICAFRDPYAVHLTHDGLAVQFWRERFGHAFKPSVSGHKAQDQIDDRRIQRIQWILPVIRGVPKGVRCFEAPPDAKFRTPPSGRLRRLYTLESHRYVVWLTPHGDETDFKFSTAYPCMPDQLEGYIDKMEREIDMDP